jgi:predicted DNA-binding transcriptional regulator YafY
MGRLSKVISILTLLNNRQYVTMETVKSVCEISERTAYRYIKYISLSGIPIYFDRKVRGYRIVRQDKSRISDLTLNDTILIVFGLILLKNNTDENYSDDITSLIKKVLCSSQDNIEELLSTFMDLLDKNGNNDNVSQSLKLALIQAAIVFQRSLKMKVDDSGLPDNVLKVDKLSLSFKNKWTLVSRGKQNSLSVDVDDIAGIHIL